jgi:hypothetical protein
LLLPNSRLLAMPMRLQPQRPQRCKLTGH